MTKDYKLLYEATKLDLKDQVELTERLQDNITRLEGHLASDVSNRRERIATEIYRRGFWDVKTASDMERWIEGETKIRRGLPYDNPMLVTPVVKKRKYTKKSKRWKKKSAKKST